MFFNLIFLVFAVTNVTAIKLNGPSEVQWNSLMNIVKKESHLTADEMHQAKTIIHSIPLVDLNRGK